MKRKRQRIGCTVETHRGKLRVRYRWHGRRYSRTTTLIDTADNRARVEKLARLIGAAIAAGKDPQALLFKPNSSSEPHEVTVARYYSR
ncbi:MAG: Arm DNA-binding domain-containing protein [Planctomycetota bacterium]